MEAHSNAVQPGNLIRASQPATAIQPTRTYMCWLFGDVTDLLNAALMAEIERRGVRIYGQHCIYYGDATDWLKKAEKPPDLLIFGTDANNVRQIGTASYMFANSKTPIRCVVILPDSMQIQSMSFQSLTAQGIPFRIASGEIPRDVDWILSHLPK